MGTGEISSIIIVVISVLLVVFNNNKAKGSQAKAQSSSTDSQQQVRDIINQHVRHIQQSKRRRAANNATSQPGKQEVLRSTATAMQQPNKAASTANDSSLNQDNQSEKSQIEEIAEDFTIEKAVIYSEILNPKFKEY